MGLFIFAHDIVKKGESIIILHSTASNQTVSVGCSGLEQGRMRPEREVNSIAGEKRQWIQWPGSGIDQWSISRCYTPCSPGFQS
jgi:hypothetical protein